MAVKITIPPAKEFPQLARYNTHYSKTATKILRALDNKFRQLLIKIIHENKSINVKTIHTLLKARQSVTSNHLRILKEAGILQVRNQGRSSFYSVDYDRLREIDRVINVFTHDTYLA